MRVRLLVLSMVLLLWSGSALAQGNYAKVADVTNLSTEVAQEVYSPFCPGKTLAMCTSPAAAEVRRDIQKMAKEGMAKEDIKTKLIEEYGEEFRLVEPPSTDNVGLLVVIAVGLLAAAGAITLLSRRKGDPAIEAGIAAEGEADPYLDELRQEYQD